MRCPASWQVGVRAGVSPTTHSLPIFMPAKLRGGPTLASLPVCLICLSGCWSPFPPSCLLAGRAFCPQKTRSLRGLCQASSRCSGSRAPSWKHLGHGLGEPQVGGALIQALSLLPGLRGWGRGGRSTARGSSRGGVEKGMDARKRGWGWRERLGLDSCVLGFRSPG